MKAHRVMTLLALAPLLGALSLGCEEDVVDDLPPEPQIFPRINPVNICQVEVGRQATVDLMLDNRGQQRLDIYGFEVHHDRRCAFTDPAGDVRLFDNDDGDDLAASVRSRDSAFMRIQYAPPSNGEDEIAVTVHSNAANFPDLEIFVCGGGVSEPPLRCNIRTDTDCRPSGESCSDDNPCALRCFLSDATCDSAADCPDDGDFCYSPHYCVLEDPTDPNSGTCQCRPCAARPDDSWEDCSQG